MSCCAEENVVRTYAFDPLFALSLSLAAKEPVLTIALCTAAVPSPAVVAPVQAEKFPDSKPSLKIVVPDAARADGRIPPSNPAAASTAAATEATLLGVMLLLTTGQPQRGGWPRCDP